MLNLQPVHNLLLTELTRQGYRALVVGGAVRDHLLQRPCNDIDIATDAPPSVIEEWLKTTNLNVSFVGKRFGVFIVEGVELATFRNEFYHPSHEQGKRPKVLPALSFQEDTARRDYTINAMGITLDGRIIDYQNGIQDLNNRIIRAVGNPDQRYQEDPSRILRGIELASRLNFTIEDGTEQAIRRNRNLLREVPEELKGKILRKVVENNVLSTFLEYLRRYDLLEYMLPELAHTVNCSQNPAYHCYDVFGHIVAVVRSVEYSASPNKPLMLYGALCHDIAKGLEGVRGLNRQGQPNDLGHEEKGVPIARKLLTRFCENKQFIKHVLFLVEFHGIRFDERTKVKSYVRVLKTMASRTENREEFLYLLKCLVDFMFFDHKGFAPEFQRTHYPTLALMTNRLTTLANSRAFFVKDLELTGHGLISIGFRGKEVGEILNELVDLNLVSRLDALDYIRQKYGR